MMSESANPFRQILAIKRNEWPLALLLSGYFFLVITSFWILKPIKKAVFIGYYSEQFSAFGFENLTASQAELFAKVLNMVVAFFAAILFSVLADRLRRQQLTILFSSLLFIGFGGYAYFLNHLAPWVVWSFYLFGDLYNVLMVATFFAFANDSINSEAAKRMYGVIGLGGVIGGAVGSTFVLAGIDAISYSQWMGVSIILGILIILLAIAAGCIVDAQEKASENSSPTSSEPPNSAEVAQKAHPAIEGARLVFSSRYLLALVALVGIYEVVSSILDFQFTSTIEYYAQQGSLDARKAFAAVYSTTNWTAMFLQFTVTSLVMQRLGVGIALLFLPIAALSGSVAFFMAPIYLTGGALSVSDNAFNYSINQSARETLYTVTSRNEKYKAKAFIDMFIKQFAKAIAVLLNLAITMIITGFSGVRWLSVVTIPLLLVWLLLVRYLGTSFRAREAASQTSSK